MTRLLLIEDDQETAEDVAGYFRGRGYEVDCAATGPHGLAQAGAGQADVLVVDRLLPGLDGLTLIEALRHAGVRTPALVLSALDEVDERVRGLRAGGDDYLGKPFALAGLAARIEALLRRPADGPETLLRVGPLELDLVARTARRAGRVLDLLPREFRLLEYMMRRAGQTVTRAMLFEDVWNYRYADHAAAVRLHLLADRGARAGTGRWDRPGRDPPHRGRVWRRSRPAPGSLAGGGPAQRPLRRGVRAGC